jgi:uncharacterized protein (TIGR04255 family)
MDMTPSVLELLALPETANVVFERPPLVLAICQVKFGALLGIADPAFVAPFQRAIQDRYPLVTPTPQLSVQFGVGPGGATIQTAPPPPSWQFSDREDNWKAVLAQDFCAIETRAYERFSDLAARLGQVLEALTQHLKPTVVTRLGLRYVNEIREGHGEWSSVVRKELLGPLAMPGIGGHVTQALQEVTLRFPGGQQVVIRHGLLPGGTTVQPQSNSAIAAGPFYLLDFDAYEEFQPTQDRTLDRGWVCEQAEAYNRVLYRLFRWSISPEYTATLGERPYADD